MSGSKGGGSRGGMAGGKNTDPETWIERLTETEEEAVLSFLNHNSHAKHKEIYVRYVGVQSMARGTTYDFSRISLAIFNDVVKGQAEAVSQAWNEKVYSIVKKDVGMAGGSYRKQPISIIFVTTIQASGDVSDRLANDLASLVYKVPAIEGDDADIREFVQFVSDDIPNIKALVESIRGVPPNLTGKQVTSDDHKRYCDSRSEYQEWFQKLQSKWSAEYPMWDFVFEIFAHGSETFLQERQHITGDEQFRRFRVKWFQPYKEQPLSSGSEVRYAMTVDWSGQPKEGNDPRAIYCGAYHRETEDLYTLGVWCDIATDEETFEKIYEMFWMCFPWYAGEGVTVYMEDIIAATGISKSYIETMRQKKILEGSDPNYYIQLPIKLFNTKVVRGDKLVAISALRPYAEQGHIWYIPGHTHQGLMLDQFKHYEGKHTHSIRDIRRKIDIPDTVSMFYFTVIRRGPSRRPVILTSSPKEPPKPQQRPPVSLTSPAKSGRRKMLTPS